MAEKHRNGTTLEEVVGLASQSARAQSARLNKKLAAIFAGLGLSAPFISELISHLAFNATPESDPNYVHSMVGAGLMLIFGFLGIDRLLKARKMSRKIELIIVPE
ncbi:MAG: hypothetical protein V4449_04025 [Patescibacteria group bacterium]